MFWNFLPKGSFYIGNSLFIFSLCMYLFAQDRQNFIKFVLFGLSINNLLDELIFNPTKLGYNELFISIALPLIWLIKYNRNARKIHK